MAPEIICTLIALCGTVASGLISWLVARSSAEKEIKKMRIEWEHDKLLSSDDDFSEMASSVAVCLQSLDLSDFDTALASVASLRIRETGPISLKLDKLYSTLYEISPSSCPDPIPARLAEYRRLLDRANDQLTEVINEKRNRTGG